MAGKLNGDKDSPLDAWPVCEETVAVGRSPGCRSLRVNEAPLHHSLHAVVGHFLQLTAQPANGFHRARALYPVSGPAFRWIPAAQAVVLLRQRDAYRVRALRL